MEDFLKQIPDVVQMTAICFAVLVLFATVVARIIPGEADDEAVGKVARGVMRILAWLPTIGVNPRTQKLEEAYNELLENQKPKESQNAEASRSADSA